MSGGELERPALTGRVVDDDAGQLDDAAAAVEVAAEAMADMGAMLGAASYRGMDNSRRIIDSIRVLQELHNPRDLETDFRCKTCRTSSGKPAPWPCVTMVEMSEALGVPVTIDVEKMRDWGRVRNGGRPQSPAGRALFGLA